MKSAIAVLLGSLAIASLTAAQEGVGKEEKTTASTDAEKVKLTLKIRDEASGLELAAEMDFPKGTNGFKAMSTIVQVKPKRGGIITDLCGVHADGQKRFWSLNVDGTKSKVGINSLTLEEDTVILWQTQDRK